MSNEQFVVHKNAPGPSRLQVEKADNSGKVNTDPQFVADRQAITNTITAYSYLIDEGRWNDWYSLFSDDIEFGTTVPELGTVTVNGKKAFVALAEERYVKPGKTSTAVRRHTQGNVHVVEQTPTTAKVRTYMLISNVPAGDKLHLLTTGTYNANLEKRDGRWVITRWYIECDAPLAPNQMPEGFSEAELKWVGDPTIQLPDAVPGPTKGLITVKEQLSVMPTVAPLYKMAAVNSWERCDIVLVDYLTDAKSAAAFLPEQLATFPIAELPGYSAVKLLWARYRESSVGPYDEFLVSIPCLYEGELYLYVPLIYVTTDTAMASGREVGGWPKKIANIGMEQFGNEWRVTLERGGERLLSVSMKTGRKLFSTPLPGDKPVNLPYPFNMTLPLPTPTGKPLANFPFPTMALKVIPGVGSDNPSPEIAQLIGAQWRLSGNIYAGADATVACYPSADDPFHKLPVLKVLGSMYVYGDMSLALKEIKVVEDLLRAQPVAPGKEVAGGRVA